MFHGSVAMSSGIDRKSNRVGFVLSLIMEYLFLERERERKVVRFVLAYIIDEVSIICGFSGRSIKG